MSPSALQRLRQAGATLIELVVSIVIVGIAAGGVLLAFHQTVRHSADPMVLHQAVAIGEAYMEEILLKPVNDPDADGEATRPQFDDVDDYNGLNDVGARDQDNNLIAGLGAYTINVTVGTQALPGIANALRVDVQVTGPNEVDVTLSGYRTDYF
ncbi:MAG: prepilin-type N-terminal cleavage/methylation domain-containing protein [Gammaproteobacteria bacterium]|nr:prepilin-type N-terminal cleavage/methylation domain-containing protein [Gammaproteobacteria bacterium]